MDEMDLALKGVWPYDSRSKDDYSSAESSITPPEPKQPEINKNVSQSSLQNTLKVRATL